MMEFNNYELSWLSFNDRVLQEAQDTSVPLLQRLRFLGIFSNNQDEFIKVRVANLMRLANIKNNREIKTPEGYPVRDILHQVHRRIDESQALFSTIYSDVLTAMEEEGICVLNETQLTERQKSFCRDYFSRQISPQIVPLMLRKSTKMPFLTDKNVYLAVKMATRKTTHKKFAIIQIPVNKDCPRFVELPSPRGRKQLIFVDDIIRLCLDEIFFMFTYDTITAHTFKLIRDAQLTMDDDISKSVLEKVEKGLEGRLHGEPVRLVYDRQIPCDLLGIISSKLKLKDLHTVGGSRYHMMKHLMNFPVIDPKLEYTRHEPVPHPELPRFSSIIKVIRQQDVFLNFPYFSFDHVIDLLREAAVDPKVEKIGMTLYRTANRSKIVNALINAAENGKVVVVMEELMARFDEEQNVVNSDMMQKAGIKVIHGSTGLKVHAKLIYIERNEKHSLKGYSYIGTGNFNESTARTYTDFGLLTANTAIGNEVRNVFELLQNPHKPFEFSQLLISPYYMRKRFDKLISNEIRNKNKGKEAYIYAKFNSLTDIKIIRSLYKASKAGVEIRLIIRGACCLQPQIAKQSENIRAISIVDQYLEHARLVIFHNGGEETTYILSADWMSRNLDNRIEVGTPVYDPQIRKTIRDIFDIQWSDNTKARDLSHQDENYYVTGDPDKPCRSQWVIYDYYH